MGSYATLLSQGADITGGINLRPPHISGLLQYLMVLLLVFIHYSWNTVDISNELRTQFIYSLQIMWQWVFLPDVTLRKQLALPPPDPVDYRAACFCHRQLIDQGHVCSVCLSSIVVVSHNLSWLCFASIHIIIIHYIS